jgi:hypothetical protein
MELKGVRMESVLEKDIHHNGDNLGKKKLRPKLPPF